MNMINCWKSKAYCCNKKKNSENFKKKLNYNFIHIYHVFYNHILFLHLSKNKTKQIVQELKHFVPISVEYIESTLPHLASFKLKKDDAIQTAGLSD